MRAFALAVALLAAAPAAAQVQSRPTDPPLVAAANESWYRLGEPIQFAGELYYRARPPVFFDGNTMIRTGHYNGVPLYADTTQEPFSIVLVPVGRGLMQPYERVRSGEVAGTTGSQPPSFPVRATPDVGRLPMAPSPPTSPPLPQGAISVYTPEPAAAPARASVPRTAARPPETVGTTGITAATPRDIRPVVTVRRPESNDGIWIRFGGQKWVSAGPAVPITAADFLRVGEYAGFPVFARRGQDDKVIYVPTRAGRVAPYRLKLR